MNEPKTTDWLISALDSIDTIAKSLAKSISQSVREAKKLAKSRKKCTNIQEKNREAVNRYNAKVREKNKANPPTIDESTAEKKCNKCHETKKLSEFYRIWTTSDCREKACKKCQNARRMKRYYESKGE